MVVVTGIIEKGEDGDCIYCWARVLFNLIK